MKRPQPMSRQASVVPYLTASRKLWWRRTVSLAMALLFLTLAMPARAAEVRRCGKEDKSVSVGFVDYVHLVLWSKSIRTVTVTPGEPIPGWPKPADESGLVLPNTKSGKWRVQGVDTNCTVALADYLVPGARRLGIKGDVLPRPIVEDIFEYRPRDSAYTFILVPRAATTPGTVTGSAELRQCPRGNQAKYVVWRPGEDLALPADWSKYRELLLKLSTDSNWCADVGSMERDERQLEVQTGPTSFKFDVASVSRLETPLFGDVGTPDCHVRIIGTSKPGKPDNLVPCADFLEIPAPGKEFREHRRRQVSMVALPVAPFNGCPLEPPAKTDTFAFGDTVYVCLYAQATGSHVAKGADETAGAKAGGAAPMRPLDLDQNQFANFSFTPCVVTPTGCLDADRPPIGEPWQLVHSASNDARIALRVRTSDRDSTGSLVSDTRIRFVPVIRQPDERILWSSTEFTPSCLRPPKADEQARYVSAVAELGSEMLPLGPLSAVPEEGVLCPQRAIPEGARAVNFYVGDKLYLRRHLVDARKIHFKAMSLKKGEHSFEGYDRNSKHTWGLRSDLFEDVMLCATVNDQSIDVHTETLPFDFSRLKAAIGKDTNDFFGSGFLRRQRNNEFCGQLPRFTLGDDERGTVRVSLLNCGDGQCTHRIAERNWPSLALDFGLVGAMAVNQHGEVRIGGGPTVTMVRLQQRPTAHVLISYEATFAAIIGSAPLNEDVPFSREEQKRLQGRCLAGCEDAQRIMLSGLLALGVGTCIAYEPVRSINLPFCIAPTFGLMTNQRAGAGFYETSSGGYKKVGDKGDTERQFDFSLLTSVGVRLQIP